MCIVNRWVLVITQAGRRDLRVLVDDRLAVGRDCDGLLLADVHASRRHVEFVCNDATLTVADVGSSNGTTVNGETISATRLLADRDVIELGTTSITVAVIEAGAPAVGAPSASTRIVTTDRPKSAIMRLTDAVADTDGSGASEPNVLAELAATIGTESTFTILFSDIEASTSYATRVGDSEWMRILDRHNTLIRRQLHRFGGREVKSQGDGFMMCFSSARRAVDFAVEVQRELEIARHDDPTWEVRVRIGLHAGEAVATADGDLFGRHVIIASRVADKADGGEILVSDLVRELVSGGDDLVFVDSRSVTLKGIGDQVVHSVKWS